MTAITAPARRRPNRARPFLGVTVTSEVDAAVRADAEREGRPLSRVVDDALRRALGLGDFANRSGTPGDDLGMPSGRLAGPDDVRIHVRWFGGFFVTDEGEQLHEEHVPAVDGKDVVFVYAVGDEVPDHEGAAEELRRWFLDVGARSARIEREGHPS